MNLIFIFMVTTGQIFVIAPTSTELCEKEAAVALQAFQEKSPQLEIKAKCVSGEILRQRDKTDI